MNDTTAPRFLRRRIAAAGIAIGLVGAGVFFTQQALGEAPPSTPGGTTAATGEPALAPTDSTLAPSEADGVIRDDARPSVFDDHLPAVSKLDPALLEALRRAATDARGDGVEFEVNGGWRSTALQEKLLADAVAQYGSMEEAARWVASPTGSAHVSGEAVDLGPLSALDWLAQHGADYGLCQIYANESWHYELRPEAVDGGCPAMYADSSEDPRMSR
ncbi:MAG: M15 family metallopeptidase [Microbacterium sp.]|uniref:M15 family metallopeptidase n=1 Tax=Microbacterium sp. TaxID=51671 RepID=UPI003BB17521